jgi:tight adherence protein B
MMHRLPLLGRAVLTFAAAAVLFGAAIVSFGSPSASAGNDDGFLRVDSLRGAGGPVVIDGYAPGLNRAPVSVSTGSGPLVADTRWADRLPLEVALVVDDAAGQRNGTLQLAADALLALVPGGDGPARTAVLTTSGGPDVVAPLTGSASEITEALAGITLAKSEGSDLLGTIEAAADLLGSGDPAARRAVVVVAATPERGTTALGRTERSLVASQASVEALVVGSGAPAAQLARLVEGTGGDVTPLSSDEQLDEGAESVADRLSTRFRTEVAAPPGSGVRSLELALDGSTTSVTLATGTDRRGPAALQPPVAAEQSQVSRVLDHPLAVALAALVGAGALAVVLWIVVSMVLGRRQLSDRLGAYDEQAVLVMPEGPPVTEVATVPFLQRAVAITGDLAERQGLLERLERDLERANLPLRAAEALFFGAVAALIAGAFALVLTGSPLVAVAAVLIGVMLPKVIINIRVRRRIKAFEGQLPDMLDLLAGTLRAGYSIAQGIDAVSKEIPDPMGRELQRVVNEHRLGRSLEESLDGVAERTGSDDFAWAVMAIRIQREVGGNLAELLLTVSSTMNQRERLRRDVASLTAEGRMSAMVLGLMPFILGAVMYVINPEYVLALLTPGIGYFMLGAAVVSMIIGFIWMKKLITVEV